MTVWKRLGILVFALIVVLCTLKVGERLPIPGVHGLVPTAEARGAGGGRPGRPGRPARPIKPVSVTGVATTTTRRCDVGERDCE